MKLIEKNILIVSPEPWSHIHVSKHHYALSLAERGNKVYFLNPPSEKMSISESKTSNLFVIDYRGFVKGLRAFPKFIRKRFTRKVFANLEKAAGVKFEVLWSFDNSVFFDLDAIPSAVIKICHIVDLNQDFETEKAARSADICFFNTRYIGERLKAFNDKAYFINHGYAKVEASNVSLVQAGRHNRIKIAYAGNLDIQYIDWGLLKSAIVENSDVDFYFAGSCKNEETIAFMNQYENVFLLGRLNKADLAKLYLDVDILIIAYLADDFKEQLANPHKVMEYLSSGKTIVSTYTEEYANMDQLILMSNNNNEWQDLLHEGISHLPKYASDQKVMARKVYANEHTYENQLVKVEKYLSEL